MMDVVTPMKRVSVIGVTVLTTLSCRGSSSTGPTVPSPIRSSADHAAATQVALASASLAAMSVGFDSGHVVKLVAFPPLNEPLVFRQQLEAGLSTQLRRKPTAT